MIWEGWPRQTDKARQAGVMRTRWAMCRLGCGDTRSRHPSIQGGNHIVPLANKCSC